MMRAPFTPDSSQIDLEDVLARSAIGNLQDLTIGWVPKSPRVGVPKSPQNGVPNHHTETAEGYQNHHAFLHTSLAQCALPRSAVKGRIFERRNGSQLLFIEAGSRWDANGVRHELPIPYGTRPRLILYHLCAEAVRTRSPVITMEDSARAFMRRIGIDIGGKPLADFRLQLRALAACHMTMTGVDEDAERFTFDCGPVQGYSEPLTGDWLSKLKLSESFFNSVVEHSMPIDLHAIAKLQHSALALDTYSWLTERLHRITDPKGVSISWQSLHAQTGQEYASVKKFKHNMKAVLVRVRAVYPDAKFEELPGRLLLKPSLPPVMPKTLMVVSKPVAASEEQLDQTIRHGANKGLTYREVVAR